MSNWYEVSKEIRNRTTAGVSELDVEGAADLLIRFVEEETRGTVIDEGKVVDRIRRACEDLKAYYYESVRRNRTANRQSKSKQLVLGRNPCSLGDQPDAGNLPGRT